MGRVGSLPQSMNHTQTEPDGKVATVPSPLRRARTRTVRVDSRELKAPPGP